MEQMFVFAFPNATQAFDLRQALISLQGESLIKLTDAVVVTRDTQGKVTLHQAIAAVRGSAAAGSVIGLIVGLCFLQPWVGSVAGAGLGAIVGGLLELGIDDKFMKELGETIHPGTAALFLLGSDAQLEKLSQRIGPLLKGCTILKTTVNSEREAEVRKLLESV